MKLLCAWCGIEMDRRSYGQTFEPETSHGMCSACSEALTAQDHGLTLQQHLDTIPIPVLLLDDSDSVVSMNAKACDALRQKAFKAETQLLDEKVFDCIYSHNPEGCGRKIHCSGCAIRRSVTTTFNTGQPQVLVPATLCITSLDQLSQAVLRVSTVKIGELVVLRIE